MSEISLRRSCIVRTLEAPGPCIGTLANPLNHLPPACPRACVSEPQSPRQAEDAERGRKLLAQDVLALINAVKEGKATKVERILAPRLTIQATFDLTLRAS